MAGEPINVFVSYSHADAPLVAPVVKLLRVNKSLVFQDVDSITPGKRWRGEIARGLDQSHLVVVFWCQHASRSDEVAREWQAAIAQNKDLLPLLLDATPLPAPLGEFQWIDFRATVGANHGTVDSPPHIRPAPAPVSGPAPARPSLRAGRWLSFAAVVAVFALAGILSVNIGHQGPLPDVPATVTKPPVDPKKPQPPPTSVPTRFGVPLALTVSLIVVAGLLWQRQRAKRRRETAPDAGTPGSVERGIASKLEAEILRRGALRRDAAT